MQAKVGICPEMVALHNPTFQGRIHKMGIPLGASTFYESPPCPYSVHLPELMPLINYLFNHLIFRSWLSKGNSEI
jgi:hypothetical protein